jgi:hypothetical protein
MKDPRTGEMQFWFGAYPHEMSNLEWPILPYKISMNYVGFAFVTLAQVSAVPVLVVATD